MTRIVVWSLFCLTTVLCRAQPGTYRHFTTDDGLASNTLFDILQDDDGFIWITSNMGVQRFDGSNFQTFTTEDGIPDNEVLRINQDRFGRIWFLGYNGHIAYFEHEEFTHKGNDPWLARLKFKNVPLHFYEGRNNIIHIIDQAGHHAKIHVDAGGIVAIEEVPRLTNFYWEEGSQTYYVKYRNVFKHEHPEKVWDTLFHYFGYSTLGGKFYFQRDRQVMQLTKDSIRPVLEWPQPVHAASRFLVYDRSLVFLDSKTGVWEYRKTGNGYALHRVYQSPVNSGKYLKDTHNGIWVTSLTDGLYFYPDQHQQFVFAAPLPDWPGKSITEITVTDAGQLIAGFDNSNIGIFDSNLVLRDSRYFQQKEVYSPISDLPILDKSTYVAAGPLGAFLVGFGKTKGTVKKIIPNGVKNLKVTPEGNLYFCTRLYAFIYNIPADSLTRFEDTLLTRKYAICPVAGSDCFLLSDAEGLHLYTHRGQEKHIPAHPFFKKRIIDILPVSGGRFLLLTDGEGIALLNGKSRFVDVVPASLLRYGIIKKARIHQGNVWVAGSKGIGIFALKNDRLVPKQWIDESKGLLSDDVTSFCIKDRFLYVFTPRGLQKMDMATLMLKESVPRFFVHTLKANDQKWNHPKGKIALPAGCREIKLRCATLALDNSSKSTFAYRFGDATTYIESPSPEISIPIEWVGEKTLFIRGRKGEGNWTPEFPLLLDVPVPLHKRAWLQFLVYFLVTGAAMSASLYVTHRARKRKRREKDVKLQIALLEIKSLQAMMNPHFIFNTLNSVQHFIQENDAYAVNKYLTSFSRLIRGNLNSNRDMLIPLRQELEYLENYLELEHLRLGERLGYEISVQPEIDTEHTQLPGMLIQPLLENAIRHGIGVSKRPGFVRVHFLLQDGRLLVQVTDNGVGLAHTSSPKASSHKSLGLGMVRERLAILTEMYGKPFGLELGNNPDGQTGSIASLSLPLLLR